MLLMINLKKLNNLMLMKNLELVIFGTKTDNKEAS